jgi:hypothetical protein
VRGGGGVGGSMRVSKNIYLVVSVRVRWCVVVVVKASGYAIPHDRRYEVRSGSQSPEEQTKREQTGG